MWIELREIISNYKEECGIPNLTVYDVHGINIDKNFFSPTIQIGKNTSKYKVVPNHYFACNLMHVGRDGVIPLSYNDLGKELIVSPAYFVFYNSRKDLIIDEFLYMSISRKEFDRYASFCTDSSIRDGLAWDRFLDIKIYIPDIETQKKYVNMYNSVYNNQKSYEKGYDEIKFLIDNLFEKKQKNYKKYPLTNFITERREINSDGRLDNLRGVSQNGLIPPNQLRSEESLKRTKIFYKDDIIYAPSSLKNGAVVINKEYEEALCSEEYIVLSVNEQFLPEYIYIYLKREELGRYIDFLSIDSVRNRFYFSDLDILNISLVPLDEQKIIVDLFKVYDKKKFIRKKQSNIKKIDTFIS